MRLKSVLAFGLALVAMAVFVACSGGDTSKGGVKDMTLKKWDKQGALENLGLGEDEKRFYYLSGNVGEENVEAYAWLEAHQPYIKLRILPQSNQDKSREYSLEGSFEFSDVELGIVSGKLVIKGEMPVSSQAGGAKKSSFDLSQKTDNPLSEVDFLKNTFEVSQDPSGGEGQSLTYLKKTTKAFIPSHNALEPKIKEVLNRSLAQGAKSIESLRKMLADDASKGFKELVKDGGGLVFNMENIDDMDVAYVDDRIVMFRISQYSYEGGAHGIQHLSVQTYSLKTGEKISNMIDELFSSKRNDVLDLLSDKLEKKYKGALFDDALALRDFPETFLLDPSGVAFVWQPYEVAPYSVGFVGVELSYDELKPLINSDSPYGYLFD